MNTAGGMVINQNEEVLMIFRKGKWDLPKGKQEPNEALSITAVREVEEETGIDSNFIDSITPLVVTPYVKNHNGFRQVRYANWYIMRYSKDCLKTYPQVEESIEMIEWVHIDNLSAYMSNGREYLSTIFDSYFGLLEPVFDDGLQYGNNNLI